MEIITFLSYCTEKLGCYTQNFLISYKLDEITEYGIDFRLGSAKCQKIIIIIKKAMDLGILTREVEVIHFMFLVILGIEQSKKVKIDRLKDNIKFKRRYSDYTRMNIQ